MASRLSLAALVTLFGVGFAHGEEAKSRLEMSLEELRQASPPLPSVKSCPMDDDEFWAHWATERGYEHLVRGDVANAAACYDKAAAMSGWQSYGRIATILRELPKGAINLHRETFEESARRAERKGKKQLAAKLYELTALGYARMEMEGAYGRFANGSVLHRERRSWQDGHLRSGYFFEIAAGLASDPEEKIRLLREARTFTAGMLTMWYCDGPGDAVAGYKSCQTAKATVARLDETLKAH